MKNYKITTVGRLFPRRVKDLDFWDQIKLVAEEAGEPQLAYDNEWLAFFNLRLELRTMAGKKVTSIPLQVSDDFAHELEHGPQDREIEAANAYEASMFDVGDDRITNVEEI